MRAFAPGSRVEPAAGPAGPAPAPLPGRWRRQDGAISVMTTVLVLPLVCLCGLAIDTAMVYSRGAEMRNISHAVALAAARKLNGTPAGITAAVNAAATAATAIRYRNLHARVDWSATALSFSTTPDRSGSWVDAATASAMAARMFYARVNTAELGDAGTVRPVLMPILAPRFAAVAANSDIIAGRTGIDIAPLAVCAMSSAAAAPRNNGASAVELVEWGFRRGISYNLMNLNPSGSTPASFVIDPLAMPGTAGQASDFDTTTVAPYACSGTLAIPRVTGDALAVRRPFPLANLYRQLNARFDQYDGPQCTAQGGQPDANIKAYDYTKMPAVLPWMTVAPAGQTAAAVVSGGKLQTVADLAPPNATPAGQYGPLWGYAKAVPYSAYSAGNLEPNAGYTTFTTAAWPTLYGGQTVKTYPLATSTPYKPGAGVNAAVPGADHAPGVRNRRVLNVPLLDCTALPATSANVVAVGKFFMMVPATSTVLAAEFAGVIPLERINGTVGVFP